MVACLSYKDIITIFVSDPKIRRMSNLNNTGWLITLTCRIFMFAGCRLAGAHSSASVAAV